MASEPEENQEMDKTNNVKQEEDDLDLDLDDLSVELDDDEEEENENRKPIDTNKRSVIANHDSHKWSEHKQFEDSLTDCLTISKSKISVVTELSMKYLNRYKDIVHYIEKFIRKGKTLNNTKLPQLFIIDSICRADIKENKNNHNKFIKRFGRNIDKTFHALCRGPPSDKSSIKRVFSLWNKERWFPSAKMKEIMNVIRSFQTEDDHHHKKHKMKPKNKHKSSKKKHKKKNKKSKRNSKKHDNMPHVDNALLKSLQSLTNNEDDDTNDSTISHDSDDTNHDDDDVNMQIKLERLKAANRTQNTIGIKRKIHSLNANEATPDRKKIKIDNNNNINHQNQMNHNALHHQILPPQAPPIHNQMRNMMNPPPHYMYAHGPPPMPPHAPHHPHPHYMYAQPPAQPQPPQMNTQQQYGIGWELSPDQLAVSPDRYRVLSCTIYVGFWNDVHVDIDKLRQEGNEFGPVLKIMPHPTKPPHKHAFIQFGSRVIAENAKSGLRKRFNHLQFVQKVGWGRPPKLVKESFKFDTGIGEILRSEAPHIQHQHLSSQTQQAAAAAPQIQAQGASHSMNPNGGFVNIERQRLINGATAPQAIAAAPNTMYHHYNAYAQTPAQPQPQQAHHPYY